jgi:integrase/recombinase XerD
MTSKTSVDLDSFEALLERYCLWLQVNNYSESTLVRMRYVMVNFQAWSDFLGITRPREVTRAILESYKRYLYNQKSKKDSKPLKMSYIRNILTYLKMFFRWCTKQGMLNFNPMAEFDLPKRDKTVVRSVLSPLQVEQVLGAIEIDRDAGLRDRAVLETIYSTGMRRMEAGGLDLCDVDFDRGLVLIRLGKGKKDRLIPIGDRALAWIDKYLIELRPKWAPFPENNALFLSRFGRRLDPSKVGKIARDAFVRADMKVKGSAHVFRHAMATAMLNAGADIRHIQEILGHENVQSTQIYTKVSVEKLKRVHEQKHPAGLKRE